MEQSKTQWPGSTVAKVALAMLAGLVVLVLLFPASGIDPLPPQCFSVFGYTVPCEPGASLAAAAATAALVGVLLWLRR